MRRWPRPAISASPRTTASSGPSRRSSGPPWPAGPSPCSGTTTASIPHTRAAGTGPTTACWDGCGIAAGGCAPPPTPSGWRPALRRVGEPHAAAATAGHDRLERVDGGRHELRAGAAAELTERTLDRHRLAVDAVLGHRVVGVAHGDDARPAR